MGILSLVEDRPTPKAVYNWRVYYLAAVASCASCMIGYDSAFIGTTLALDSFQDEFRFADLDQGAVDLMSANIVSCYQAGAFFGALFAYPIGHFWGRKIGLIVASVVFILGSGMMLGVNAERGLGLLYGGRVLAGIGVGAGSNLVPIYISELSPPSIRGRLVGVYELGWQIGGLVGFWINVRAQNFYCYPPFYLIVITKVWEMDCLNTSNKFFLLFSMESLKPWLQVISNGSSRLPFS